MFILSLKYNSDFNFFMFGNNLNNLNGQTLSISNVVDTCANVVQAINFTGATFGGVDYGGVVQQSTGKWVYYPV